MVLNFKERENLKDYESEKYIEEKLILLNKGKSYGQILFLAGGSGSGKGFAINNFLEGSKFRIRDVDEVKKGILQLSKLNKLYPELKNFELNNPEDVYKLHQFVKDAGIMDKRLNNLLKDVKSDRLPNILFDMTFKDIRDLHNFLPKLLMVGYEPKNIHIVWVLTNYELAKKRNEFRGKMPGGRMTAPEIVLNTARGAAVTMFRIIQHGPPNGINGAIHVVLGNDKNIIYHVNSKGEKLDGERDPVTGKRIRPIVVKSFAYIRVKEEGKSHGGYTQFNKELLKWIMNNAPASAVKQIKKEMD